MVLNVYGLLKIFCLLCYNKRGGKVSSCSKLVAIIKAKTSKYDFTHVRLEGSEELASSAASKVRPRPGRVNTIALPAT